jgi:hypothetical protein
MAPAIRTGERVLIEHVRPDDVRVGDVLLLEAGGSYVLHRLVTRWPRMRTKGDALPYLDAREIAPGIIAGRASAVLREGQWRTLPSFPHSLPLAWKSVFTAVAGPRLRLIRSWLRRQIRR